MKNEKIKQKQKKNRVFRCAPFFFTRFDRSLPAQQTNATAFTSPV
jgi:hypothetical protein